MDALTAALIAVEENRAALTGPQGEKGERGESITGPQGIRGPQGVPGKDGAPGKDGQPGLVWRGTWSRGTDYNIGDVVEADGSSYVATAKIRRNKPPSAPWDLVAQKGSDGITRVIGAPGPPGPSGGGGGGGSALTVKDEGSDLDTAVTAIDVVGDGVTATAVGHAVTITVPSVYVQSTDPGAVGAGRQWLRTDASLNAANAYRQLYVRNAANSAWIESGIFHYDATGQLREEFSISDVGLFVMHYNATGKLVTEFVLRENGSGDSFGIETYMFDGTTGALLGVHSFDPESYAMTFGGTTTNMLNGSVDPSAGGGLAFPLGSIYMRSSGEVWTKTGAGATAWSRLLTTVDGATYQPLDATLTALAGLATGANKLPYSTGADTFSQADLTAFARTILDDANATAVLGTLGIDTDLLTLSIGASASVSGTNTGDQDLSAYMTSPQALARTMGA